MGMWGVEEDDTKGKARLPSTMDLYNYHQNKGHQRVPGRYICVASKWCCFIFLVGVASFFLNNASMLESATSPPNIQPLLFVLQNLNQPTNEKRFI